MVATKKKQQPVKKQKKNPKSLSNKATDLGLKTADQITEVDDLQFELGRLRTHLEVYPAKVEYKDKELGLLKFSLLIDPLNKQVTVIRDQQE